MEENYQDHIYALILAGGGGTRLWPRSTNKTPKQFLKLFSGKTLTQITCDRFSKLLGWDKMFCVTVSEEYKAEIIREVPNFLPDNIIVEPARRETGPAHGIGALYIRKKDPNAVIITESADRLVDPVEKYLNTLKDAAKIAFEKRILVAVGVKPRYAHTGLGHIKRGQVVEKIEQRVFYKVEKFVEKPPIELAEEYTKSGEYYWNAGQFVWRSDTILSSLEKHSPDVYKYLLEIENSLGKENERDVILKSYESMPKIAIDYAVAEKSENMVVVEADFFWTDIGDWNEVWKNLPKDSLNNVVIDGDEEGGEVINLDSNDTLVNSDGRLIVLIDVDNMVVVDSKNVLLICPKDKSQNVKKIVEKLKEEGRTDLI